MNNEENTQPAKKKIKKTSDGTPKKKKVASEVTPETSTGDNEDHLKSNEVKKKQEDKPPFKSIADAVPINDIIDYLIDRVGEERFSKIAEKAKDSYDQTVTKLGEDDARRAIELGVVKATENKLLALKKK